MPRHIQRNKLSALMVDEKRHYKLYKDGKMWAVAGLSLLVAGSMMLTQPASVKAAVNEPGEQAAAQAVATIHIKRRLQKTARLLTCN